jgi:hypothetical protein
MARQNIMTWNMGWSKAAYLMAAGKQRRREETVEVQYLL